MHTHRGNHEFNAYYPRNAGLDRAKATKDADERAVTALLERYRQRAYESEMRSNRRPPPPQQTASDKEREAVHYERVTLDLDKRIQQAYERDRLKALKRKQAEREKAEQEERNKPPQRNGASQEDRPEKEELVDKLQDELQDLQGTRGASPTDVKRESVTTESMNATEEELKDSLGYSSVSSAFNAADIEAVLQTLPKFPRFNERKKP